jgi:transcriptional regulator with XRE-family HTH domain
LANLHSGLNPRKASDWLPFAPQPKRLIAEVTKARITAGLSQRVLAAKLRRSPSYISKFEAGERRLEVCEFLEICDAIGEDAQTLIGWILKG